MTDHREFTDKGGRKNKGRLSLLNPQIINGGQTAYTLSDIFEKEYKTNQKIFDGKEVLVRVVELSEGKKKVDLKKYNFITEISSSTNKQTAIKDADRHSRNPILQAVQDEIFRKYGYFFELKRGEYYDGLERKIVVKDLLVDRATILRSYKALKGNPSLARRQSEKQMFDDEFFKEEFENQTFDNDRLSSHMFFAYKVHKFLVELEKRKPKNDFGYALRYGKYAIVSASYVSMNPTFKQKLPSLPLSDIETYINSKITELLGRWKVFESYVQSNSNNKRYFDLAQDLSDFDNYYKGGPVQADIEAFF